MGLLAAQDEYLGIAVGAAHEFLALFGPNPDPKAIEIIANLMGRLYSVPTLSLERSASADFLSSGQLTQGRWGELEHPWPVRCRPLGGRSAVPSNCAPCDPQLPIYCIPTCPDLIWFAITH